MSLSSQQTTLTTLRGVQQQIQRAFEQTKYSYCLQLIDYSIDLLNDVKEKSQMVRGIEVGVRSLKGYLCYKYFEGREEEGEEEFKRAEGIDRWSSVVLRRRMECWVMRKEYERALVCCQDLLMNEPENLEISKRKVEIQKIIREKEEKNQKCSLTNKSQASSIPDSPTKVRCVSFQLIQPKDDSTLPTNPQFKNQSKSAKSTKSILKDSSSFTSSISSHHHTADWVKVHEKKDFTWNQLKYIDMPGNFQEKGKMKKQLSVQEKESAGEKEQKEVGEGECQDGFKLAEKKPGLKKSKSVAFRNEEKQ